MQAFTSVTAVAAPLEPVNVDTDQIIPARFIKEPRGGGKHYGGFLFRDLRLADDGSEIAGFVLNRGPFRDARIIVANRNFGCGSSREGAVYALVDAGFRAVIAPSFGDIFFANCLKNGVVPARLPDDTCARLRALCAARPGTALTVDLERLAVIEPDGSAHGFAIDAFWREALLHGLDEVGLTRALMPEVAAFERAWQEAAPWVVPAAR